MTQTVELGSSPDTDIENKSPEVITTEGTLDAPEVAPSTTEQGDSPISLHDHLLGVVEKMGEVEPPPTEPEAEPEASNNDLPPHDLNAPPPSGEKDKPEEGEERLDDQLPFHKHPRFQELVREKNSYKEEATQFRAISDYMAENHLSADEVDQGFLIMSAIKNNPVKAREMLAETMRQLDQITGEILDEDGMRLVDEGEMSENAARELSRLKAQIAIKEQREEEARQLQASHFAQQTEAAIINSVEQWEQQIAKRDPDYAAKKSIVFDKIRLAQLQQPARNAQEAVAYADAAYRSATEALKAVIPRRGMIQSPTSSQSLTADRRPPKTLEEAVKAAAGVPY